MDFLDPKKKRHHLIRLYIGYVLIGLIIAMGSIILLLQSYGYGVDRKTGQIIQNGLVFVAAQPEQADIYLNNKLVKSRDTARLVLPEGSYTLELKRDGYRSWKRSFNLLGGSLERFVYPFLFPEKLEPVEQQRYATPPGFATQSPDRRWLLVQQPGQLVAFDVFDANDPKKAVVPLTLPASLFTASDKHTTKLVEWSTDNRHVLVEHIFTTGHEFVVIDREAPAESVNINKSFNRTPTQVAMRDKRFDRLYLYDQTAQRLDFATLKDGAIKPVQSGVLAFKSHSEDMLVFATTQNAEMGKANIMVQDGQGTYRLREVTADAKYLLDIASFDGRWYIVAGAPTEHKVYVYKDPLPVLKHQTNVPLVPATVLRVNTVPTDVSFSANARFVAVQGGQDFAVYDAEADRTYRYHQDLAFAPDDHARWMDGHRLYAVIGGKLTVFDYDGINQQTLTPNLPGMLPFFDRDYKLLYNIAPSSGTAAALTRTPLKIQQ